MAKSRPKARTKEERAEFAEKRRQQVAALRERLAKWQEDTDPAVIAAVCAQLDGYSERNAMLIAMQYPTATDVDGYGAWRKRGRHVKARPADVEEGEWGIKIIAWAGGDDGESDGEVQAADVELREPAEPGEESGRMSRRFKLAYVYDISQTDPDDICRCGGLLRKCECGGQTCPGWTHTGRNGSHWCAGSRDLAEPVLPVEDGAGCLN